MIPLMMRKAKAERISNRFALSLYVSCFCAELAAAVVLPVQAVLLRKLQAAQIAVVLFEVRGQMLYAELCLQLLPDGIDAGSVLVGLMDRVVVNQSKPLSRAYCAARRIRSR